MISLEQLAEASWDLSFPLEELGFLRKLLVYLINEGLGPCIEYSFVLDGDPADDDWSELVPTGEELEIVYSPSLASPWFPFGQTTDGIERKSKKEYQDTRTE